MTLLKTKRRIDFDKSIGNIKICSFHYGDCSSGEWKNWTEIKCFYEQNCEDCPLGWEDRSYEGECYDCGCLFDKDFDVPVWKCMLPKFVKKLYLRRMKNEN